MSYYNDDGYYHNLYGWCKYYHNKKTEEYCYKKGERMWYREKDIPEETTKYNGSWYQEDKYFSFAVNMEDPYLDEHYDKKQVSRVYWAVVHDRRKLFFLLFLYFISALLAIMIAAAFSSLVPFVLCFAYILGVPILERKKFKKSKKYEFSFVKELIQYYCPTT